MRTTYVVTATMDENREIQYPYEDLDDAFDQAQTLAKSGQYNLVEIHELKPAWIYRYHGRFQGIA